MTTVTDEPQADGYAEERKKRLLRRVEKLLKQADGTPFQSEAETAMLMAQRILVENGMSLAEVNALSEREQKQLVANELMVTMGPRYNDWLLGLARVVAKNFRCKIYVNHTWTQKDKHHIRIVGFSEDVAVCRDVYAYARQTGERLAKAYAKQPGVILSHLIDKDYYYRWNTPTPAQKAVANRELQRIWLEGFCAGLAARFTEQIELSNSMAVLLVIHPVVQSAYKDLNLGKGRKRPTYHTDNADARAAGYQAGKAFTPERPARLGAPTPRLGRGH